MGITAENSALATVPKLETEILGHLKSHEVSQPIWDSF